MNCRRRTDCLSRPLSGLFEKLGSLVGSYPLFFFVIPLILTAALGGGLTFLKDNEDNDLERQYTPKKGPSKVTRALVKENFPFNDSMFSEDRLYDQGIFASLIAQAENDENILENGAFKDLIRLNREVLDITVYNGTLGFKQLCAKANSDCVSNTILEIFSSKNRTGLVFPFHPSSSGPVFLGSVLGGVVMKENGSVISARAVKLFYYLEDKEDTADAARSWLRGFKSLLSKWTHSRYIKVSYYTSKSKQEEIDSHTTDGAPLFLITYACAITFSVISCLRLDNVRNKVWVAVFGVFSSGLAIISSFGLLLYIGVPFVITVANSPFLILGIGLNNMFVLISDWQHTKVKDSVPHRMAHSYKEAVMSITITALVDLLKFSIGVTSDFPAVQSFCIYTSASIVFCYFYTITFFGSFLALNGKREADNRHWLTCIKVPSDKLNDHSDTYNICCVGGRYDPDTGAEKKQPASNFFKDYYGPFLIKPWVKGAVILLFVGYLSVSIYGCFHVQQGIELYDLASDDSHVTSYIRKEREFFSAYGPTVMVIVGEEFPYWDEAKRRQLEGCIEDFKELEFVDKEIFTSWLDSYYSYGDESHLNLDEKELFLKNLSNFFDLNPFFKQDVNLTGDAIYASRFFIQTVNISDGTEEMEMLHGLTDTAEKCSAASLQVYNQKFIFYDQYDVVVYSTIKNVAVITAVMLVVSLLLIPDPLCSLWVTFSIGSVTVGVTGMMWLWDVNLDSISMIIFTVCIGFTVDFSAHVSYAFVSSEKTSPNDKAVDALSNLGYPILQGALSTILGVSVLATSEFNTFRTFSKIFFLVMSLGMLHGLIFIPVILTLFTTRSHEKKEENVEKVYQVSKF
ncbi:patched domain-containing protein 3-like [Xyrichtys novacula]|uniref:Patched domain-containing protein 3 n=1 Tax=Xyrichtys novacula TaxID=13765 RepID=A0AAV1H9F7_XYRNO|nr:patched domain-containing protein 3-like [Xyrichtys novacula]